MKLKKVLAGVLASAMVLTSVPMAGSHVSATELQVVDEDELAVEDLSDTAEPKGEAADDTTITVSSLSMETAPSIGGKASDSQITAEGADAGAQTAPSNENTAYAVSGTTKFMMKFKMKLNDASSVGSTMQDVLNNGGQTGWILQMNQDKFMFWCQAVSGWPQTNYIFGSNGNLTLDEFEGKWHDVIAGYNGQRFVLFIDDKEATDFDERTTNYALQNGAGSTISFGSAGLDMSFADATMYVGDNVPDVSSASTASDVIALLADKTPAGTPLSSKGNFLLDSTAWTNEGSAVSHFTAGTVTGTATLTAKDGYTFSREGLPTAITVNGSEQAATAAVSGDGKTMTVSTEYTLADTVKPLEIKSETIYANSWTETSSESGDGPAAWAFDTNADGNAANTSTHWHSNYVSASSENKNGAVSASNPVYIQAGFGSEKNVTMISYRARADQASNVILGYEILAANSAKDVPDDDEFVIVAKGTLSNTRDEQIIKLPHVVKATHIRIQATSSSSTNGFVTASNIAMYEETDVNAEAHPVVAMAMAELLENEPVPTVSLPEDSGYTLTSCKWYAGSTETQVYDATQKLRLEAVLTPVSSQAQPFVAINGITAQVEAQTDGTFKVSATVAETITKRYDAPAVGSDIFTAADTAMYDDFDALSVDIVLKWNEVPAVTNDATALFTLSDKAGHYVTLWYAPRLSGSGAICLTSDGVSQGLYFSKASWEITDTEWHKISVGISSKNQMLYIVKDGNTTDALNWSFTTGSWVANAWTPMNKLIGTHGWHVSEVLVGKKATNGTYNKANNNTTIYDAADSSGIQVKYIEVSSRTYSGTDDLNTRSNSKLDKAVAAERDALLAENLVESDYTADSWTAYQAARTAAESAATDWAALNAMETMKTALVREPKYTVTINGQQYKETYKFGELITVTADEPEAGKQFVGWQDVNSGKIVSYSQGYGFYVVGNMNLKAYYADDTETVTKDIALTCTASYDATNNIFTAKRNIPSDGGYNLVAHGVVVTTSEDVYNDCVTQGSGSTSMFERGKTGVRRSQGTSTALNGTYVLKLRRTTGYLYARAYVTYEKDGATTTVYSDPVAIQYTNE